MGLQARTYSRIMDAARTPSSRQVGPYIPASTRIKSLVVAGSPFPGVPMTDALHPAVGAAARARSRWSAERRFYLAFAVAIVGAVVLGFSRTFFFKAWFPEWAAAHGAPEMFFYVHGVVFVGWLLLLLAQPTLVSAGRLDLHRRLGWVGAGLALAMVLLGTVGSLIAAGRPTGFVDVPVPPLQFLTVPLADIALFAGFVTLAIVKRRRPQSHKRLMLLASIAVAEAGIARWPFAVMNATSPVPGFGTIDLFLDLFLVPLIVWDLASRGRVHPVTLWGGLAVVASQPLRTWLGGTDAWLAFAGWAVSLVR